MIIQVQGKSEVRHSQSMRKRLARLDLYSVLLSLFAKQAHSKHAPGDNIAIRNELSFIMAFCR